MALNLALCTYNSSGHGIDRLKYMQYLVDKNDFVLYRNIGYIITRSVSLIVI